jgi:hypothetical protein
MARSKSPAASTPLNADGPQGLPRGVVRPGLVGRVFSLLPKLIALYTPTVFQLELGIKLYSSTRMLSWTALFFVVWPVLVQIYLVTSVLNVVCKSWVWHRLCENGIMMRPASYGFRALLDDNAFLVFLAGPVWYIVSMGCLPPWEFASSTSLGWQHCFDGDSILLVCDHQRGLLASYHAFPHP